jgi:addiction module RelE/StbE family toxin
MKLRFDARAIDDLRSIRAYIKQNAGSQAAERVRKNLHTRISRLRNRPLMGVPSSAPELRILPPTRYPYRIYYTIQDDTVVILHIRHTARQLPNIDDLR